MTRPAKTREDFDAVQEPARPRSGWVSEGDRKTQRLTLRLRPEVMAQLYSLSTEVGEPGTEATYAEVVTQALAALSREMDAECAENEALGSVLQSGIAEDET
jgi:hypothetical protein